MDDLLAEFETLTEEHDQCKHVYACFGLAIYSAQCLETGLAQLLAMLRISHADDAITQGYETLEQLYSKQTLGRLIRNLREQLPVDDSLESQLQVALDDRNYLAHSFWFDKIERLGTASNRRSLVVELLTRRERLRMADHQIDSLADGLLESLGIGPEQVERALLELRRKSGFVDAP